MVAVLDGWTLVGLAKVEALVLSFASASFLSALGCALFLPEFFNLLLSRVRVDRLVVAREVPVASAVLGVCVRRVLVPARVLLAASTVGVEVCVGLSGFARALVALGVRTLARSAVAASSGNLFSSFTLARSSSCRSSALAFASLVSGCPETLAVVGGKGLVAPTA